MIRPLMLAMALATAALPAHAADPKPAAKPAAEQKLEAELAQARQETNAWRALAGEYKAQRDAANDQVAGLAARIDLSTPPPAPVPAPKKP